MRRLIQNGLLAIAMVCALAAYAQESGEQAVGRGQFAGMQRVGGTITAVSGDAVTVKAEDGTVYQVTTTPNTRVMKGQGVTVKVADLKVGDGVTAAGNMDAPNKTLHAAFVMAVDADQLKKLRENLGKTYIAGKVTAIDIDNLKMTVMRQDGVSQMIGFDEGTSFKRGGRMGRGAGMGAGGTPVVPVEGAESITLADIKVGDNVTGTGTLKSGVFVPGQLNVGQGRQGRGERGERGAGSPANPGSPGTGAQAPAKPPQ
jgi:hypothetical protein